VAPTLSGVARLPFVRSLRRAGLVVGAVACALAAGCGGDGPGDRPEKAYVSPLPHVVLTLEDRAVWAPGPADRAEIPVLLYHGVAPVSAFSNAADAGYGLDPDDFAKQMVLLHHAGYRTVSLEQFVRFARGEDIALPAHPLLLTFDDARADSFTGADRVLRRLGFRAVMFVDAGAVDRGEREYLSWPQLAAMQRSGRWEVQLHAGRGHHNIRYGAGPRDVGPFYAYRATGEDLAAWRARVVADLRWGERLLAANVPGYRPLAFAPPYGNYGQAGTNDPAIPRTLRAWLLRRYAAIFTQDRDPRARPGQAQPLGRLQVTRKMTGGQLHAALIADP
jgi:peptidoglycan/xylan/chitin deacetylase (PgdA/CDA1 family)